MKFKSNRQVYSEEKPMREARDMDDTEEVVPNLGPSVVEGLESLHQKPPKVGRKWKVIPHKVYILIRSLNLYGPLFNPL